MLASMTCNSGGSSTRFVTFPKHNNQEDHDNHREVDFDWDNCQTVEDEKHQKDQRPKHEKHHSVSGHDSNETMKPTGPVPFLVCEKDFHAGAIIPLLGIPKPNY
jgi:hypothetical protein